MANEQGIQSRQSRTRDEALPPSRPHLGTTAEVAAYLGVPIATIHRWRTVGTGPAAMKVGKHLRWRWEIVDEWLDERSGSSGVLPSTARREEWYPA